MRQKVISTASILMFFVVGCNRLDEKTGLRRLLEGSAESAKGKAVAQPTSIKEFCHLDGTEGRYGTVSQRSIFRRNPITQIIEAEIVDYFDCSDSQEKDPHEVSRKVIQQDPPANLPVLGSSCVNYVTGELGKYELETSWGDNYNARGEFEDHSSQTMTRCMPIL